MQAIKDIQIEKVEAADVRPPSPLVEPRFRHTVSLVAVAPPEVLAERVFDHWLQDAEQGIEFDLRNQPVMISRLAEVPAGFVVVVRPDGSVLCHQPESRDWLVSLLQEVSQ